MVVYYGFYAVFFRQFLKAFHPAPDFIQLIPVVFRIRPVPVAEFHMRYAGVAQRAVITLGVIHVRTAKITGGCYEWNAQARGFKLFGGFGQCFVDIVWIDRISLSHTQIRALHAYGLEGIR